MYWGVYYITAEPIDVSLYDRTNLVSENHILLKIGTYDRKRAKAFKDLLHMQGRSDIQSIASLAREIDGFKDFFMFVRARHIQGSIGPFLIIDPEKEPTAHDVTDILNLHLEIDNSLTSFIEFQRTLNRKEPLW